MPEDPSRTGSVEEALSFMQRAFGYHRFRSGQEEIVASILDGRDALIIMPTGGGKSLCYQIPSFIRDGITLILSPLIALMKDQVDALRVRELPAVAIHSLMGLGEQKEALNRIMSGRIKLVYAAPERLRNRRFIQVLMENRISMVAVDEAHCISQWGHDFRPDYMRISQGLRAMGRPQTIALTATATERVRTDIIEQLQLRAPKIFITGFDRRNLFWEVAPVRDDKEKLALLKDRFRDFSGAAIIYAGTRKKVENIVTELKVTGLQPEAYHAGMEKADRTRVQDDFMEGRRDLVVATNAFGMGIDRPDIRMVIHYSFPGSIEAYYQESGRAGRDGDPATCLLFYSPLDRRLQEFFIESRYPSKETVFTIYNRLRRRAEDVLWLTYREIGNMGEQGVSELTVASCIKILEDAAVLVRLNRFDNRAELYLTKHPDRILETLSRRAGNMERLIRTLGKLYDEEQLVNGIQFLQDELAETAGLNQEALRNCLLRMEKEYEATYIPPFRGRGLRILQRPEPEKLEIDFQAFKMRKAYELEKLDQVIAYASGDRCRRRYLLGYFGESAGDGPCHACDVCDSSQGGPRLEGAASDPVLAVKILSGVARLRERFGMGTAAKVLTGSSGRMIDRFGLRRLSTYGLLSEYTQLQVLDWIRELISKGCLVSRRTSMGKKSYPVLILTDRGYSVMSGKEAIRLSGAVKESKTQLPERLPLQTREMDAFERLRELRTLIAREERLPSYCIFHDRTLREMARNLPVTPGGLLGITGVGEVTMRKYGGRFLDLIQEIKGEN